MRTIVILCSLLAAACAKPIPVQAPKLPPASMPACFAPAGSYMAVAGLQKHNCTTQPRPTILSLFKVEPNSIPCGLRASIVPVDGGGTSTLVLKVGPGGMVGMVTVANSSCVAIYSVVFLKMR